jgi:hypothetical protein
MSESGIGSRWTRRSTAPACTKYHERSRFMTWCSICTSASRISPLRGSTTLGPAALGTWLGTQRTIATPAFSPPNSGSSFGASAATIPLEKPAASNAGCHSSIPRFTHGTSHAGVAGST